VHDDWPTNCERVPLAHGAQLLLELAAWYSPTTQPTHDDMPVKFWN
jgi:hypothetical protein